MDAERYQGAPAPATAFLTTVSKIGVFALVLRYAARAHLQLPTSAALALTLIAIASMLMGNLLALRQDNAKRMLAYSSISHLGYALVVLLAAGPTALVGGLLPPGLCRGQSGGVGRGHCALGQGAERGDHARFPRPRLAAAGVGGARAVASPWPACR